MAREKKERKKVQKHWYRLHISECPVCGNGGIERERVYGEKPKDYNQVVTFIQHYDWCNE